MAVQTQLPDIYELRYEDVTITYAPGVPGVTEPRVEYCGPLGLYCFEGDEVCRFESPRGLELTITLDRVSRFNTFIVTVFLPELPPDDAGECSFRTIGIHATARKTISRAEGAELSSQPLELVGVARFAEL